MVSAAIYLLLIQMTGRHTMIHLLLLLLLLLLLALLLLLMQADYRVLVCASMCVW